MKITAGSIKGLRLFLLLIEVVSMISSQSCNSASFPKVVGGPNSFSGFNIISYHSASD